MRVLIPVGERELIAQVRKLGPIRRLLVERTADGWRVIFFLAGGNEPLTVAKRRGGVRSWSQLESVVRWLDKNVPHHRGIELYLEPLPSHLEE